MRALMAGLVNFTGVAKAVMVVAVVIIPMRVACAGTIGVDGENADAVAGIYIGLGDAVCFAGAE